MDTRSPDLYGGEAEIVHFIPLDQVGSSFFDDRRILVSANYSYTKSKLKITDQTIVGPDLAAVPASALFRDGAPLTGQSDHLVNLQLGFDAKDHLSQQTFLVNYASKRVTNRGPIFGASRQPDIFEKPGVRLDFVAREELPVGKGLELKIEARNLLGTKFQEYQQAGDKKISVNTYRLGRMLTLSVTAKL